MAPDPNRAQEGTIGFECNQCTRTNATDLTCGLIARVMLHPGKDGTDVEVVSNVGNMVAITLSEQQNAAQEGRRYSRIR